MLGIAVQLAYLLAAVCFVLGLKGMSRPKTAVAANALGAVGMLLAVRPWVFSWYAGLRPARGQVR